MNKKKAKKAYEKGFRHEEDGKAEKQYNNPTKQGFYDEGRHDFAKYGHGIYSGFPTAWEWAESSEFDPEQFDRLPDSRFNMMREKAKEKVEALGFIDPYDMCGCAGCLNNE